MLLEPQLLEKAKNERIKKSNELIERICKHYLRGIVIDDDIRIALHNDAAQAIKDILDTVIGIFAHMRVKEPLSV